MRSRVALVSAVALVVSASVGAASDTKHTVVKGPWLLTALPSMGTVTWRCDTARERRGQPAVALGLDARGALATETMELRANGVAVLRRVIQPGQRESLPFLRPAVQTLTVVQETKPGTLRGVVTVRFGSGRLSKSHCWEHLPPAVTVRVFPRGS